jgi:hypothetical protein
VIKASFGYPFGDGFQEGPWLEIELDGNLGEKPEIKACPMVQTQLSPGSDHATETFDQVVSRLLLHKNGAIKIDKINLIFIDQPIVEVQVTVEDMDPM